jgi:hypothetical protein
MRYWQKSMMNKFAAASWRWFCLLCALAVAGPVHADGITVQQATSRLLDDTFVIDAEIDYRFSDVALQALENGVPLTVDVHVQVRRDGAWIWESDITDFHKRRQLRYLPLSSTYEVVGFKGEEKRQFVSRLAAIDALGEIRNMPVVSVSLLEEGETYRMEIRSELDIEALPVPLRPTAYMSSGWELSSGWSKWRIRR